VEADELAVVVSAGLDEVICVPPVEDVVLPVEGVVLPVAGAAVEAAVELQDTAVGKLVTPEIPHNDVAKSVAAF